MSTFYPCATLNENHPISLFTDFKQVWSTIRSPDLERKKFNPVAVVVDFMVYCLSKNT